MAGGGEPRNGGELRRQREVSHPVYFKIWSGEHATAASWTISAPQGSLNRDGPIPAPLKDKGERRERERERARISAKGYANRQSYPGKHVSHCLLNV